MKVRAAGKSHMGLKRRINEDSYLIAPELDLYVIADGMGGHKAGEVASHMVIETLADYWRKVRDGDPPDFLTPIMTELSEDAKHLVNSLAFTNIIIHEAQKKPKYHRMGSTVSALLVDEDCIWAANVGDSPIFHFDQEKMTLVSEEHSVEAEQKAMGMTDSLTSTSPLMKNMLTRVMGLNEKVEVHITTIRPGAGDMVLVCSDGLTNYLPKEAIHTVLDDFSVSLERKVDILIDEANRGGGGDNISVILLEVLGGGKWGKLKSRLKGKG
jgi:protein phosphatase